MTAKEVKNYYVKATESADLYLSGNHSEYDRDEIIKNLENVSKMIINEIEEMIDKNSIDKVMKNSFLFKKFNSLSSMLIRLKYYEEDFDYDFEIPHDAIGCVFYFRDKIDDYRNWPLDNFYRYLYNNYDYI